MKKFIGFVVLFSCAVIFIFSLQKVRATEQKSFQISEYATIRWGGRDNTCLIRPNGQVEMLAPLFQQVKRPDRVDERSFLMNIAMNSVAKEGYEFAGFTSDEIIMKRAAIRQ